MPLVDMPLEELKEYKGRNPKPDDFEQYWERALKELDEASLEYTLEKADIETDNVECFELYFTGVGGAVQHCKLARPKHITQKLKGLCMFHGYTGHSGGWIDKIAYASSGFVVLSLDTRGQGGYSEDNLVTKGNTHHGHIIRGLSEDNPDKLFYRNAFLDTAQTARILMSMDCVDESKVGAVGFSQGGALTVACAALEPRLNTAAVGYPFLTDYKRIWEMDLFIDAYAELLTYLRFFDPQHKNIDRFFTKLGYIDLQHLAHRIKANVTFFTGLADTICPPSSQFAIYNKITSPKHMEIYPDYGHEGLPMADEITFKLMSAM